MTSFLEQMQKDKKLFEFKTRFDSGDFDFFSKKITNEVEAKEALKSCLKALDRTTDPADLEILGEYFNKIMCWSHYK